MAGEQRKHLSSYLYDAAAVLLLMAHDFTTGGIAGISLIHIFVFSAQETV